MDGITMMAAAIADAEYPEEERLKEGDLREGELTEGPMNAAVSKKSILTTIAVVKRKKENAKEKVVRFRE